MLLPLLSAEDFLANPNTRLLDLRAEDEFVRGHLPGSVNLPILRQAERHQVGLCYKQQGSEAAVALAHSLVLPTKMERVAAWRAHLAQEKYPVLACWRGGMRSEFAQRWLAESGMTVARIAGGYKALRHLLHQQWEKPFSGFVLSGLTGSGKTSLLQSLPTERVVDLEGLACHRGSAFGGLFQPVFPAQQSFENALALQLLRSQGRSLLVEHESRLVGRLVLPKAFFLSLLVLPRLVLEVPFAERVDNILEEYVRLPLRNFPAETVCAALSGAVVQIRGRLGGLAAQEIAALLSAAFQAPSAQQAELHRLWIARLLREYYDPLYRHSNAKHPAPIAFCGDRTECLAWLRANTDFF